MQDETKLRRIYKRIAELETNNSAAGVTSINGQTGDVTLAYNDVGAAASAKGVTNGDSHDHSGGDGAQIAYSSLSGAPTIPDELSDLSDDATHRTVTDTEKSTWNGKQDALTADTDYLTPGTAASTYSPVGHDHDGDYEPLKGEDDNYVTDAEKTVIGNTSGTNSGDEDQSSIKTKLGAASAIADGYLTSADWGTFNGKQAALTADTDYLTPDTAASTYSPIGHDHDSDYEPLKGEDDNYVTDAQLVIIGNTSGSNSGDEDTSSIKTKLGAASAIADGYLTSTDWSTFNGKQSALTADTDYLTPGTAASTYEPLKGEDDNYVTDAEKTVLGNTSGTNSGDQDLSGLIAKTTNVTAINDTGIANGEIAVFNLTNKDIRTSDTVISTDGTLSGNADTNIPTEKAVKTYSDTKIAKTTNITALNETGIADGEIAVFNLTNKDIRTSNVTITTTLGADDLTIPTSAAVASAITAGGGYTDENAQDAVGGMVADTGTIDLTYTDATPELKADLKASSVETSHVKYPTGSDTYIVTGTKGTSGNLVSWNADGDAVDASIAAASVALAPATNTDAYIPQWDGADSGKLKNGKAAPTGDIVGTSDTQTLTSKTLTNPTVNFTDKGVSQNVKCKVYMSGDQANLINGTWTLVNLDTESYDTGSDFNTSTYVFCAPVTGYYLITASVRFTSVVADKRYSAAVQCTNSSGVGNGTYLGVTATHSRLTSYMSCPVATMAYLASGTYFGLFARSESGGNTVDVDGGAPEQTCMDVILLSI